VAARLWQAYREREREAAWAELAGAFHRAPVESRRLDRETRQRLRALGYVVD
jgi:hypothetical protein